MSGKSKLSAVTTVAAASCILPMALLTWLSYLAAVWTLSADVGDQQGISPTRWLAAILLTGVFVAWGLRKKSLSRSGALVASCVGFILTLSSYCFLLDLMAFFLSSSKLTKFQSSKKRLIEEDFKDGGQRNWVQVICNGGAATLLAALYILDVGIGEQPVDFNSHYRASWLSLGILGSFACANGDTWASEVGSVLGDPFLITTGKKVPRGTNGGVSLGGLLCSFVGGLVIGIAHYIGVLLCIGDSQIGLIVVGALAGFFGSLFDSVLGATLQYSGKDKERGCIVDHPGPNVVHISGKRLLDNHSVNLISTVMAAILTPSLTHPFWG